MALSSSALIDWICWPEESEVPSGVEVRWSADLVEEFVHCLADSLQPSGLHHGQIRIGDVPDVRRNLVSFAMKSLTFGLRIPANLRQSLKWRSRMSGIFVAKSSM